MKCVRNYNPNKIRFCSFALEIPPPPPPPPSIWPSTSSSSSSSSSPLERHTEEEISSMIGRCTGMRALKQVHAHVLKLHPNSSSGFALTKVLAFAALSSSGDIGYARKVFAEMPDPSVFCWNSMIRGCSHAQNPSKEPILLYKAMLGKGLAYPNSFTVAFVLKACTVVPSLWEGRQVHSHAFRGGLGASPFVQTGLLNLYAKCEEIDVARKVFDGMPERNLVAWSAMICGYSRIGMANEALELFKEMQVAGIEPDEVAMVSVISACANAGALELGRWMHAFIDRIGINVDLKLSTALVDMYAKCGEIEKARKMFDEMEAKDTHAWSAMIVGLAVNGLVEDALELFSNMQCMKVKPNHVTYIGVLLACAHSGLVSEGRRLWTAMDELGLKPQMEHYGCMVDLLCRTSRVEEALVLVESMPMDPNAVIWRTVLVGCKAEGSPDRIDAVAERLLSLEPLNPENYVLLSNIYASMSDWSRVSRLRKKMQDHDVKVAPGCSSIEIEGLVHRFIAGDDSHAEIDDIRGVLRLVSKRVRAAGHTALTLEVLHDVAEEEKENALCEHSERLAIAYGMLKTQAPAVIRVVKNLRVCFDCHEVTKIISGAFGREIVVRDRLRFHRFLNGACSCKDFW